MLKMYFLMKSLCDYHYDDALCCWFLAVQSSGAIVLVGCGQLRVLVKTVLFLIS